VKQLSNPELENLREFFREFFYIYNNTSSEDTGGLDELVDRALTCSEILGVRPDEEDVRDE
jgi:hypothetical protein